jgi:hypothetical protein
LCAKLTELPTQTKVTAIHLFNIQGEPSEILRLHELAHSEIPILPSLLSGTRPEVVLFGAVDFGIVLEIADEIATEFG